jgi:hypothetical protein
MVSFLTKISFYMLWHGEGTLTWNYLLAIQNNSILTIRYYHGKTLHYSEPKLCVLSKKIYVILSF